MSDETSITVNQEGVNSFAAALWNPQQYEIFIDDQKIGELDGYTNPKTCAISPGPHSVYVRACARNSVSFTRVYGYSQTLEVTVSRGEDKRGDLPQRTRYASAMVTFDRSWRERKP
jgi:hypothetical protein